MELKAYRILGQKIKGIRDIQTPLMGPLQLTGQPQLSFSHFSCSLRAVLHSEFKKKSIEEKKKTKKKYFFKLDSNLTRVENLDSINDPWNKYL